MQQIAILRIFSECFGKKSTPEYKVIKSVAKDEEFITWTHYEHKKEAALKWNPNLGQFAFKIRAID